MESTVCTLFEGHYHFGVGALVNSLYKNGFQGIVWVGYRGKLPPWAKPIKSYKEYEEFVVAEGCVVRFIHLDTKIHFGCYKPSFMIDILNKYQREAESIFYFDPDIVIKCPWHFYERWVKHGIALCQDVCYWNMPSSHPLRMEWKEFADKLGYKISHQLEYYVNSGFVGLDRKNLEMLDIWKELLDKLQLEGIDLTVLKLEKPYEKFFGMDQDMLNLALMITKCPLSTMGPEGMDFIPGGYTMSHAVRKPWKKNYILKALNGEAPTSTDKEYWKNVQIPIELFPKLRLCYKKFSLLFASAIGRFTRRS